MGNPADVVLTLIYSPIIGLHNKFNYEPNPSRRPIVEFEAKMENTIQYVQIKC